MAREPKRDASGRGGESGYRVPFPAKMYYYTDAEIAAVVDVMRDADVLTQGEHIEQFEEDFRAYVGANHAFAVDNCTNALRLTATLCGLRPDDEVIIPAYTYCATAIPFGDTGARIVWADIDPKTWIVSLDDIARKITGRTRAIVVVHLLGMPVDMDPVMELAARHGLLVVEDCAQAPGAACGGRKVGTMGDFGCFSFHAAKNMTTLGEGGMLTLKSDEHARRVPGLRHNGSRPYESKGARYWVPAMANVELDLEGVWPDNFSIGEAQCALGKALLKRLDQVNDVLIAQAMKIREGLADIPELCFQEIPEGFRHVFHQCVAHFDGSASGKDRDDLLDILTSEYSIQMIVQYYPLYRYPLFRKLGLGEHDCPNLEAFWDNSFSFPWWCGITDDTIDYMIAATRKAVRTLREGS